MTTKTITPVNIINTLSVQGNQIMASSTDIADVFGKRHDNVVRTINAFDFQDKFTRLNFEVSDYLDETGKKNKSYQMTKDGFYMLAMGFTGKKAFEFKKSYITAFNQMQSQLTSPQLSPPPVEPEIKVHVHEDDIYIHLTTLAAITGCETEELIKQIKHIKAVNKQFKSKSSVKNYALNIKSTSSSGIYALNSEMVLLLDLGDNSLRHKLKILDTIYAAKLEKLTDLSKHLNKSHRLIKHTVGGLLSQLQNNIRSLIEHKNATAKFDKHMEFLENLLKRLSNTIRGTRVNQDQRDIIDLMQDIIGILKLNDRDSINDQMLDKIKDIIVQAEFKTSCSGGDIYNAITATKGISNKLTICKRPPRMGLI